VKRVLFLDDDRERHRRFREAASGRGWWVEHVETAPDAIDKLRTYQYDAIFLDHDLSDEDVMMAPGAASHAPTGMDVVSFLVAKPNNLNRNAQVVVHSLNAPAAEQMMRRLLDAGLQASRVPFHVLVRLA
jgi:CheY-like chemotaxis protein